MHRFILLACLFFSLICAGQEQDSVITVGIKNAPPFVHGASSNSPHGLSIEFWDLVNDDIPRKISYLPFSSLPALLKALEEKTIDLSINPITVTDKRMEYLDYSQPFFISGTTLVRPSGNRWTAFFSNLFSWSFFSAAAILLTVILLFGLAVWFFERRANPEQFAKGWRGVADGFWWSAVTMTTVGYGDKAPVSRGGRIVGFIWMFAAILMISGLTAGIASSLTVSTLSENIESTEDLKRFQVGSIAESSSADYLKLFAVDARPFQSVEAGLTALQSGKIDVFVYDRPILQYYLKQGNYENLRLMDKDLKTDYYSFSYPKGSPLRESLDPVIVRALKSERWNRKLQD